MDLQPYSHYCFSKISRTLFEFLKNTYWVSLFKRNNSLIFRTRVSCFSVTLFYSTLFCCGGKANLVRLTLFYSTLLTFTNGRNYSRRNKYTRFAWAGGTFYTRFAWAGYEYQKMGLIKNGTTCVTKTTTHTSKKLRKWPNPDPTTPSSMALFGHYLAKNHPTKNAIEQKYSPRACASSGHAPWHCPTDVPFHGFPPALLTFFYIMNRQQGSRSG